MIYFSWDPKKAAANPRKHKGITFIAARKVFFDPHVFRYPYVHEGEDQWRAVGVTADKRGRPVLVTVPHELQEDDGDEYIHIISAWPTTPEEARRYRVENGF